MSMNGGTGDPSCKTSAAGACSRNAANASFAPGGHGARSTVTGVRLRRIHTASNPSKGQITHTRKSPSGPRRLAAIQATIHGKMRPARSASVRSSSGSMRRTAAVANHAVTPQKSHTLHAAHAVVGRIGSMLDQVEVM